MSAPTSHGTVAIANVDDGVEIDNGASANTIGGTATGAGNTIAFNTDDAVNVDHRHRRRDPRKLDLRQRLGHRPHRWRKRRTDAPVITGATSEATGASSASATISVDLTATGFTAGVDLFARLLRQRGK